MTTPEERLQALGLELPSPVKVPDGLHLPFAFVNVRGDRAIFSGHPRQGPDGAITGPYGVLGGDLTTEEGYSAAQEVALSILANLKAEIGEFSRITGWVRVFGMVISASGFRATPRRERVQRHYQRRVWGGVWATCAFGHRCARVTVGICDGD